MPPAVSCVEPELLEADGLDVADLPDAPDLEAGDPDLPRAVALDVDARVDHRERQLAPHLGRAHGVGEDDDVGHVEITP